MQENDITPGSQPSSATPQNSGLDEVRNNKILAIVSHLGPLSGIGFFVIPFAIWYLNKTNEFVAEHAKQAMFYQGVTGIFAMVFGAFSFIATMFTAGLAGFLLLPAALLMSLVLLIPSLIASYKALNGEQYNYPVSGALSKKL